MAVTTEIPVPAAEAVSPRRITIEEFERIPDDVFPDGERLELIDGLIYTKVSQNDPHIFALRYAFRALQAVFASGYEITVQLPLKLGDRGKPEPDLVVLRGATEDYEGRRVDPPADIVLLIEISDSSLQYDQVNKARLYARYGVPEYWIVNLQNRTLEVRRRPRPETEGYAETIVYAQGESVPIGDRVVAVADLLPKGL